MRYAGQLISAEFVQDAVDGERTVERLKDKLLHFGEERPHVLLVLGHEDQRLAEFPSLPHPVRPGDKAVVALWLAAVPDSTEYIVYRAAPGMPKGDMPDGMEGRWDRRSDIPYGVVSTARTVLDGIGTGTAKATGQIEISPDGSVAEVYEVKSDYLP